MLKNERFRRRRNFIISHSKRYCAQLGQKSRLFLLDDVQSNKTAARFYWSCWPPRRKPVGKHRRSSETPSVKFKQTPGISKYNLKIFGVLWFFTTGYCSDYLLYGYKETPMCFYIQVNQSIIVHKLSTSIYATDDLPSGNVRHQHLIWFQTKCV